MDADSGRPSGRGVTPLGWFGAILAVLVAIEGVAWLWGQTLGAGLEWWLLTFFGGFALIVAWFVYLVTWGFRRRRFAWHLLIIPTIGLLALAAAFTGLPQKARWSYDEPRLTEAAQTALADPRAEFEDQDNRTIGTQEVYATGKAGGVITFSIFGGSFSVTTLEYRADGSVPEFGGEVRGRRLSDDWWLVLID